METREKIAILRRTQLFDAVSEKDLVPLVARAREIRLEKGELLFHAGDPSQGMYVVLSGRTRAARLGTDGREQVIHEDRPGATFAEVAVFDDGPYPSSVTAAENSALLFLPKEEVRRFCIRHPEAALSALRLLSTRLRRTTGMVEGIALREVSQRLAEFLLREARRGPHRRGAGSPRFPRSHTNQEIASLIGTVHEVVSRAFARLERRGWIRKDAREIEILDEEALAAHARGEP